MSKRNSECIKKTSIGGQALIEGIMMRGPKKTVLAVRLPDKAIATESLQTTSIKDKYKILGLPVIRGAVSFIESMIFGYKALMTSAERSGMLDEEDDEKKAQVLEDVRDASAEAEEKEAELPEQEVGTVDAAAETTEESVDTNNESAEITEEIDEANNESAEVTEETVESFVQPVTPKKEESPKKEGNGLMMGIIGVASLILGIALALVLFMYLPTLAFEQINKLTGEKITLYRALFEGTIKIVIFIGYISLVSLMKDIKRVFMYHGAEHKAIFCYEMGLPLTVENVRKQQRFHPRCGTSFLILMLIVSILIYAALSIFVPVLTSSKIIWVGLKLVMLPVICGIGYELIKFCGRHDNIVTRIISAPGMWVQRITTKEPDDSMIEVAIAAMVEVIPENEVEDKW